MIPTQWHIIYVKARETYDDIITTQMIVGFILTTSVNKQ